jgi:hypothetical protein
VTAFRPTLAALAFGVVAACGAGAGRVVPEPPSASPAPGPVVPVQQAQVPVEVRYLRGLLDDMDDRSPHEAVRDALAAAPGTLPAHELLRLEDDLLALADRVDGQTVERLLVEPGDGIAPGLPIRVQMRGGAAVRVRVDCHTGCRVVGVDP